MVLQSSSTVLRPMFSIQYSCPSLILASCCIAGAVQPPQLPTLPREISEACSPPFQSFNPAAQCASPLRNSKSPPTPLHPHYTFYAVHDKIQ
ncbi:hypothetical protein DUNSADRAFT_11037 [Dunaliella salina]|uniref:Encoded protein n=1 Tax=Dunaliella salina TaxID=3046 RepID=A0ABQ7GE93_DUNSA|nr:hypothetical protein DUNSADRAFT_11037 [Dunaliella salina]|eukprot:KAF5832887.1 hypothetical protein DUNSADRAFT_11037 [Dunaliella salina]